jgi:tRNA(adenine34) deaminase
MKEKYMKAALRLARISYRCGDVPVGAVVVKDRKIIGYGFNKKERLKNPLAHAEIIAINMACEHLNSYHLEECDIYVTLEPCLMCVGAILNARIKNIYFGARNKRFGAVCSHQNIENLITNHKVSYEGDILQDECSKILTSFFSNLRNKGK